MGRSGLRIYISLQLLPRSLSNVLQANILFQIWGNTINHKKNQDDKSVWQSAYFLFNYVAFYALFNSNPFNQMHYQHSLQLWLLSQ